jgi:tol-pal system protein YbgF
LETRLQQLEQEYPDAPAPATGSSEGESLARESLETRLQQLEQEYPDTPAAATGSSDGESLARENAPGDDSGAFEERLDLLANQYENPPAPANQNADPIAELEEEPTVESTPFERTLRLLQSEADETSRAADYLNSNADTAPVAANGNQSLGNRIMEAASPFAQGYEGALYDFYAGRYAEAVEGLSRLIEAYPNHILASNCYYWLGEAQLQANNIQGAIASFTRVLEFEKSLKKDNALLMLGKSYMFLKRSEEARTAFNRVIAEYPTSEAVNLAQEYLRSL